MIHKRYKKEELPDKIELSWRAHNLTNQIFGKLTALYPCGKDNDGSILWVCQCSCSEHNYIIANANNLKRGVNKTCGSHEDMIELQEKNSLRKRNELVGLTFHNLYVDSYSHIEGKRIFYNCTCQLCGSKVKIRKDSLINGHAQSCGCLNSKGEAAIKDFLNKNHIEYISEYKFPDLKDKSYLRFDFGILYEGELACLIEFDGRQHYINDSQFFNDDFEARQRRDNMKNEYCMINNIPLYRIRFDEDINKRLEEIFNVL